MVLDDDRELAELAREFLSGFVYLVSLACHPDQGLELLRREMPDQVEGLGLGADDYLPKPFEPMENDIFSMPIQSPGVVLDRVAITAKMKGMDHDP